MTGDIIQTTGVYNKGGRTSSHKGEYIRYNDLKEYTQYKLWKDYVDPSGKETIYSRVRNTLFSSSNDIIYISKGYIVGRLEDGIYTIAFRNGIPTMTINGVQYG